MRRNEVSVKIPAPEKLPSAEDTRREQLKAEYKAATTTAQKLEVLAKALGLK